MTVFAFLFLYLGATFSERCEALQGHTLSVPGAERVEVVQASFESADPNQSEVPVEHCRVLAETETVSALDPGDRSTIRSVIRLPLEWNRRLLMGGIGGLGGDLGEDNLGGLIALGGTALERGFLTVVNDTGHVGASRADVSWALDVPPSPGIDNQNELNFAVHSTHLSVETAKRLARDFYRRRVRRSYFHGCSNGGRQALVEATTFPDDFDGIVAGSPAQMFTDIFSRIALTQQAYLPIFGQLTQAKVDLVSALVVAKCDGNDGVLDGILADPRRCDFEPHADLPACPGDIDGPSCFTSDQRSFIELVHSDVVLESPSTLSRGFLPSSEGGSPFPPTFGRGWSSWITGTPVLGGGSIQLFFDTGARQFFIFDDPDFDELSYLATSSADTLREDSELLSGLDLPGANLSAFKKRGGKLILYHGWMDPSLAPEATIDYFQQIQDQTRGNRDSFARLFMVPGMVHCDTSGPGAHIFDAVEAITDWVEDDRKPNRLRAVSTDGTTSRPLCKYPTEAVYRGGDPNEARSFVCRKAR